MVWLEVIEGYHKTHYKQNANLEQVPLRYIAMNESEFQPCLISTECHASSCFLLPSFFVLVELRGGEPGYKARVKLHKSEPTHNPL